MQIPKKKKKKKEVTRSFIGVFADSVVTAWLRSCLAMS